MISVNFASTERLVAAPGCSGFADPRHGYIANFTGPARDGAGRRHLYVGTAVPRPPPAISTKPPRPSCCWPTCATNIDRFDRARILTTVVTRDDWPPQRAVSGFDLPPNTPFADLWTRNAVKEYANGGTTACAETAQIVAGQVAGRYPADLTPRP